MALGDCPDMVEVKNNLTFAKSSFKHHGQGIIAQVQIEQNPTSAGTYRAVSNKTGATLATVVGHLSGKKLSVTSMTSNEDPKRGDHYLPGLPFRILRHLRETGMVTTLRIQVNTEVYSEVRRVGKPPREHFYAHWAGYDLVGSEQIPLYNIEESGYQTWLVFKPAPEKDINDALVPGGERPLDPKVK